MSLSLLSRRDVQTAGGGPAAVRARVIQLAVVHSPAVTGGHPSAVAPAEEGAENEQKPGDTEERVKRIENKRLPRQIVEQHRQGRKKVRADEKDNADIWIMSA